MAVSWINSKTEICNLALTQIGDMRINAYEDEDNLNARLCRDNYDQCRDQLLRAALWAFATTRATLTQYGSVPAFGEGYQYVLPADFLRMISLNDIYAEVMPEDYRIEMIDNFKVMVTAQDTAQIRYIYRNDTPAHYDALFVRALATTLAANLAYTITGDARLAEMLMVKAERDTAKAMHENANESKQVIKSIATDSGLVRARHSSAIG